MQLVDSTDISEVTRRKIFSYKKREPSLDQLMEHPPLNKVHIMIMGSINKIITIRAMI